MARKKSNRRHFEAPHPQGGHKHHINALANLGEGHIVSMGSDDTVCLWRVEDRRCLKSLPTPWLECITAVDGKVIAGAESGSIHEFDFEVDAERTLCARVDEEVVNAIVAPSPAQSFTILHCDDGWYEGRGVVHRWRLPNCRPERIDWTEGTTLCLALDEAPVNEKRHVYVGSHLGEVGILNAESGQHIDTIQVFDQAVVALTAFGADSSGTCQFAAASWDGRVGIFSLDGECQAQLDLRDRVELPNGTVAGVAKLSSRRLIVWRHRRVWLWDLDEERILDSLEPDSLIWALVCPDETTVVFGDDNGRVVFIDVAG